MYLTGHLWPVSLFPDVVGRIKARSVAPPHIVRNVKRSIEYAEDIKDRKITTTLFLTPHTQSPMGDTDEITIVNCTGPGSMPQEPLALVAKMSVSELNAMESEGKDELASAADSEPDPTIRYRTSIQHSSTFLFSNISTV